MNDVYIEMSQQLLMQDIETMFQMVRRGDSKDKSVFMMGMMPYLAALAEGAIEFMEQEEIACDELQLKIIYEPVLVKTRNRIKLYREKAGTNLSTIDSIRENQDEEFARHMLFPVLRKIGLHYDFGTYIFNGKYIGNTFLYKWFFSEIEKIETSNPHYEFSYALGECIGFAKQQWQTEYTVEGGFNFRGVSNKDYNITIRHQELFSLHVDKRYGLFLFNLLCQINFVLYYMRNVLDESNTLFLRVKYIVYYFACSSIKALMRYTNQNPITTKHINYSAIAMSYELQNENFCNCMRHYTIRQSDCDANFSSPSFLPIIDHYFGLTLRDYIIKLNDCLESIADEIENAILVTDFT